MKREELKKYTSSEIEEIDDALLEATEDGTIKMTRVYIASEADSVMDAMEARIKMLEGIRHADIVRIADLEKDLEHEIKLKGKAIKRIKELEAQLENVQNTMATENVDLGMENNKLKERINELEAEVIGYKESLERANFKMCEKDARIRELENDKQVCAECPRLKELEATMQKERDFGLNIARCADHDIAKLAAENARLKAQVPKWISVKDRLPPKKTEIIGCTINGCVMPFWFTDYATAHLSHWMPLPPPPTEESSVTENDDG